MTLPSYVLKDKELFTLTLVFFVTSVFSKLFGSSDLNAVSVGFSAGQSHFFLLASHFGAVALFMLIRSNSVFLLPRSFAPYLWLSGYALLTAFWSASLLKSGGLAILTVFNIVWAVCIAHSIRRFPSEARLSVFLSFWAVLVVVDLCIEVAFKGFAPNLDEYSLIAFLIASVLLAKRQFFIAVLLFAIGLLGQSFSAIVGLMIFWYCLSLRRRPALGIVFVLCAGLTIKVAWSWVLDGSLTIYGKNAELLITGSGRFNAWSAVVEAISSSHWYNVIFGHGYSSDRHVLVAKELSWSVDVHNNVLHVLYGMGISGLLILSYALFCTFRTNQMADFSVFRFPIFASLFFFGLTSSYFFGRPSDIAIFWLSFIAIGVPDREPLINKNYYDLAA